jgi:large subunit ribosomal protein L17
MRHRIKGRKLNRTASHRKALIRNLANQLFEHKEIRTTIAKAKEARITIERLITYAKKGDIHHRRLAFSFLRQKDSIKKLFDEIAPAYTERQGGYTRVVKLGRRSGDGAPMALLQLVGFETFADTSKPEKKKKSRKKEEKPLDTDMQVAEASETEVKEPAVEETKKVEEELTQEVEEKSEKEMEKVKETESAEEKKDLKPEETAEETKSEELEKPIEESKPTEEKKPVEAPQSVEEESPAEDKPDDEAKTDDADSEEEKKKE